MTKRVKHLIAAVALIALGVAGRLLPHAWNATPVMAAGIIASWYLGKRYAILVPLIAMAISDALIGTYDWRLMLAVYASLIFASLLSRTVRQYRGLWTVTSVSVIGSTVFFLATNGAVWLFSPWYAPTLDGLIRCYTLGLPFYRNALLGDSFYLLSLFALTEIVLRWRVTSLVPAWRKMCYNLSVTHY